MSRLLAIDPGYTRSAWLLFEHGRVRDFAIQANADVLDVIGRTPALNLAVESVASYGMPVGAEVFETCVWTGRMIERWAARGGSRPARRVYRRDVKMHLCGSMRATDANIRAALLDRYGPGREIAVGRKAAPGPLYGVTKDVWAALAVAVTADETPSCPTRQVGRAATPPAEQVEGANPGKGDR